MNRQDYYNIITEIFKYDEITHDNDGYTLNKWHRTKEPTEIPRDICIILIMMDILEFVGGDFNTGERQYVLNKTTLSEKISKRHFDEYIWQKYVEELLPIYREMILNEALS